MINLRVLQRPRDICNRLSLDTSDPQTVFDGPGSVGSRYVLHLTVIRSSMGWHRWKCDEEGLAEMDMMELVYGILIGLGVQVRCGVPDGDGRDRRLWSGAIRCAPKSALPFRGRREKQIVIILSEFCRERTRLPAVEEADEV